MQEWKILSLFQHQVGKFSLKVPRASPLLWDGHPHGTPMLLHFPSQKFHFYMQKEDSWSNGNNFGNPWNGWKLREGMWNHFCPWTPKVGSAGGCVGTQLPLVSYPKKQLFTRWPDRIPEFWGSRACFPLPQHTQGCSSWLHPCNNTRVLFNQVKSLQTAQTKGIFVMCPQPKRCSKPQGHEETLVLPKCPGKRDLINK